MVELIRVSTQVSAGDTPVLGGLRHRADGHKVTLCGAGSRWGIPVPGHQADGHEIILTTAKEILVHTDCRVQFH